MGIQMDFLGHHRLALGDHFYIFALQDVRNDPVCRLRIRRPVHAGPGLCGASRKTFDVRRQVVEDLHPDGGSLFAQSVEIDAFHGNAASAPERVGGLTHGLAQRTVLDGTGGVGSEIKTVLVVHNPSATSSAICLTFTLLPRFLSASAMFIRHPQSQPVTVSAPVAMMLSALSSAIAIDISGSLAMNSPPKPQQRVASGMGINSIPLSASISASGSRVTPSVRVWCHEEW